MTKAHGTYLYLTIWMWAWLWARVPIHCTWLTPEPMIIYLWLSAEHLTATNIPCTPLLEYPWSHCIAQVGRKVAWFRGKQSKKGLVHCHENWSNLIKLGLQLCDGWPSYAGGYDHALAHGGATLWYLQWPARFFGGTNLWTIPQILFWSTSKIRSQWWVAESIWV